MKATGSGAFVIDGSTVINAASGTIAAAGSGVMKFDSNAHLANEVAGTLTAGAYAAAGIDFAHGSTSRLIIDAQTDITGAITAGGGTPELAANGTTIATLGTNLLSQSSDFGVIQIDAGAILDFTTTASLGAATGVVDIGKGPLTLNGAVGSLSTPRWPKPCVQR